MGCRARSASDLRVGIFLFRAAMPYGNRRSDANRPQRDAQPSRRPLRVSKNEATKNNKKPPRVGRPFGGSVYLRCFGSSEVHFNAAHGQGLVVARQVLEEVLAVLEGKRRIEVRALREEIAVDDAPLEHGPFFVAAAFETPFQSPRIQPIAGAMSWGRTGGERRGRSPACRGPARSHS